ncbi:Pycsar system effector family protein [Streptomyces rubiginosohelvolus]|uniref:Pycsar system effector family protein n=1 Tax=Streptomyces rubiginosohelvolus TaxID=67362 RepID=UPI0037ADFEC3
MAGSDLQRLHASLIRPTREHPTIPQGEADTTTAPLTTTGDRNRDAACTGVAGEIARTDSKASLLLAFDGAVLAGLASLAEKDLPGFTKVVGALAVLALAAAAVLLLLVVRPCLTVSRAAPGTFPQWARMDEDALQAEMEQDRRLARIKALSTLAARKFRRLTLAVDIILAALALLTAAAIGALV